VTWQELEAKFRGNAALALDAGRVEGLVRGVATLRDAARVADLVRWLVPERSAG
jgi:hypothetical protein